MEQELVELARVGMEQELVELARVGMEQVKCSHSSGGSMVN